MDGMDKTDEMEKSTEISNPSTAFSLEAGGWKLEWAKSVRISTVDLRP